MRYIHFILCIILYSCTSSVEKTENQEIVTSEDLDPKYIDANENFKKYVSKAFYLNSIDESGMFWSDDASDTYHGFVTWKTLNKNKKVVSYLSETLSEWEYPSFDLKETDVSKLYPYLRTSDMHLTYLTGTDEAIIAVAFGQLYIDGIIDQEMIELVDSSLKRQLHSELLGTWPEDYQAKRKEILEGMFNIIQKMK